MLVKSVLFKNGLNNALYGKQEEKYKEYYKSGQLAEILYKWKIRKKTYYILSKWRSMSNK